MHKYIWVEPCYKVRLDISSCSLFLHWNFNYRLYYYLLYQEKQFLVFLIFSYFSINILISPGKVEKNQTIITNAISLYLNGKLRKTWHPNFPKFRKGSDLVQSQSNHCLAIYIGSFIFPVNLFPSSSSLAHIQCFQSNM